MYKISSRERCSLSFRDDIYALSFSARPSMRRVSYLFIV